MIALSDPNGDIAERYSYDVFGEPNRTSDLGNPYMFTGRRYDTETGLYYYRSRYYSPKIGRFLQTDPIGYYYSMNLYEYCWNNPTNWIDPYGLTGMIHGPSMPATFTPPTIHSLDAGGSGGGSGGFCKGSEDFVSEEGDSFIPSSSGKSFGGRESHPFAAAMPIALSLSGGATESVAAATAFEVTAIAVFAYGGVMAGMEIGEETGLSDALATAMAYEYYYPIVIIDDICRWAAHRKGARESTRGPHERGRRRAKMERGGEKGDAQRRYHRKRPKNWRGPWPPKN